MAGFITAALHDIWGYIRLEEHTVAFINRMKVIEVSPSQFAVRASYAFKARGKTYRGKTVFSKPFYLNRESAEREIQNRLSQTWTVWYQPSRPKICSLEKNFPLKKCLYALMTLGVFFYFVYLDHYRVDRSRSLQIKNL